MSETTLLRAARTSPEAFGEFYGRVGDDVLRFLLHRLGQPEVALDLTAETFARCLERVERFRGRREGSARAWVFAIARNLANEYVRSEQAETRACERLGIELSALPSANLDWEASDANQYLDALPVKERDAVAMRVIDDLDYAAIAIRQAVAPATARQRVSRGLRRLTHILAKETPR